MADVVVWGRIVLAGSSGAEVAAWVVGGPGLPDLAVVEALARWQLSARRADGAIELYDLSPHLTALLDLVGLLREVGGERECGKDVLNVEECVEPGDPVS